MFYFSVLNETHVLQADKIVNVCFVINKKHDIPFFLEFYIKRLFIKIEISSLLYLLLQNISLCFTNINIPPGPAAGSTAGTTAAASCSPATTLSCSTSAPPFPSPYMITTVTKVTTVTTVAMVTMVTMVTVTLTKQCFEASLPFVMAEKEVWGGRDYSVTMVTNCHGYHRSLPPSSRIDSGPAFDIKRQFGPPELPETQFDQMWTVPSNANYLHKKRGSP